MGIFDILSTFDRVFFTKKLNTTEEAQPCVCAREHLGDGPTSVLSADSQEKNWNRLLALTNVDAATGIGFMWRRIGDAVAVGHDGGIDGYQTEVFGVLKWKIGVVVLVSSSGGKLDIQGITRAAFRAR